MTTDEFNDLHGPAAWRHDAACDAYRAEPTKERAIVTWLYGRALFTPDSPFPDADFVKVFDTVIARALAAQDAFEQFR